MTGKELSASDVALRQRVTELSVHIPCGRLRGPVSGGRWQSCLCEDAPAIWERCSTSREQDLCVICWRATAGGTSRWAWLACEDCRKVNNALARMRDEYGDQPFALTRYSLTAATTGGYGAQPSGPRRPLGWFEDFARGDDRVRRWCEHEYPELASTFDPGADIPLGTWQQQWPPSIEESVNAFGRLLGHTARTSQVASDQPTELSSQAANEPQPDTEVRRRLTELSVHVACGRVRGPIQGRWQSCPCEETQEKWHGCDVSQALDLCIVCVRGTAGGTSRWAWLGCDTCRAVNDIIRAKTGKQIPMGRHSIMNGYCVRGGASPELQREQAERLAQFVNDQQELFKWQAGEFRRLANTFPSGADIPLTVWLRELPPSRDRSIDAMIRLANNGEFLQEIFD